VSGPTTGLVALCQVSDVEEGTPIGLEPEGFPPLAVFAVQGEYYVTNNICTHAYSLLSEGYQDGPVIECSAHGGTFDIASGEPGEWPCEKRLKTYPVVVESGWISIATDSQGQDDV
jgi:ethylbenzene dioxygenase ferredoxin subunit